MYKFFFLTCLKDLMVTHLCFSLRLPQEQTEKKDQSAVTTSNSQGPTTGEQETKQRRKYVLAFARVCELERAGVCKLLMMVLH